jgi:hypothetical protein
MLRKAKLSTAWRTQFTHLPGTCASFLRWPENCGTLRNVANQITLVPPFPRVAARCGQEGITDGAS